MLAKTAATAGQGSAAAVTTASSPTPATGNQQAKGPDLRIEIAPRSENEYVINARASKGKKKNVFNDEILISTTDADKLKKYIKDNFRVYNAPATATAK